MITNIAKEDLSAKEVLKTYKQQYGVEKNFSFLKEPLIANDWARQRAFSALTAGMGVLASCNRGALRP